MIKNKVTNWKIDDNTKGLLFFAQRLFEALFNYTAEKYKASVLYTPSSCIEVLEVILQHKEDVWPIQTVEGVYDEFLKIYHNDDIAKSLVGEIDSLYLTKIDSNNLDNIKSNLELLYFKITPKKYLEKVKEQLLIELQDKKRNIEIEKLTLRFISALTHIGYSQDYIYYKTQQFFFRKNPINEVVVVNDFFNIFSLNPETFDVYLKADSLFNDVKDACSRFRTEIVTEAILTSANVKKLKISPKEFLIRVTDIKCLDPQIAKIIAHKRLCKISDLFTFFHHKKRLVWGEAAIAYNIEKKEEVFLNGSSSPMHKGVDFYPKKAAEKLVLMLKTFDLHKDSFFRFNRSIDFHGTSIDNKYAENQLIQNWIALETLIVEDSKDSKINQILSGLIPVLNYKYVARIFSELATDIERLNDVKINEILEQVPEGANTYEKLAALTTIRSNLDIAQTLFSQCQDFPLLSYRIFWLNKQLSNSTKVHNFIKNHTQRVEWHIRRIYRARNLIVHTGRIPKSIERLVESSHSYLDDVLNVIMDLAIHGKQIRTIEHGIKEITLRNKMHNTYLKENLELECQSSNFKKILWGE